MRFDGFQTMEGRHLVLAYTAVVLLQGGYAIWVAMQWRKLNATQKKSPKPL